MPKRSRFNPETFDEWRRLYAAGSSTRYIGALFGVDGGTVYDRLHKLGIVFRTPSTSKRLYPLREDAFSAVQDEATAYWLGFLFADGCVTTRRHGSPAVIVALQQRDRAHLELFRAFVGGPPTRNDEPRRACRWCASSARLAADLGQLGCIPRKSLAAALHLPAISPHLEHHFVRGYFDGDGTAGFSGGAPTLSFVGNEHFLEQMKLIIDQATGTEGRMSPHCKSAVWYLRYRGQFNIAYVREWLYRDAAVWLARKRERLDGFAPGKRQGYPTAVRHRDFVSTAGNVSAATIKRYIAAQKGV